MPVCYLFLQSDEDLRSSVPHQTLLDLLQQDLLYRDLLALHKELLVDLPNDLGHLVLSAIRLAQHNFISSSQLGQLYIR